MSANVIQVLDQISRRLFAFVIVTSLAIATPLCLAMDADRQPPDSDLIWSQYGMSITLLSLFVSGILLIIALYFQRNNRRLKEECARAEVLTK